jgi:hypothetical protein
LPAILPVTVVAKFSVEYLPYGPQIVSYLSSDAAKGWRLEINGSSPYQFRITLPYVGNYNSGINCVAGHTYTVICAINVAGTPTTMYIRDHDTGAIATTVTGNIGTPAAPATQVTLAGNLGTGDNRVSIYHAALFTHLLPEPAALYLLNNLYGTPNNPRLI